MLHETILKKQLQIISLFQSLMPVGIHKKSESRNLCKILHMPFNQYASLYIMEIQTRLGGMRGMDSLNTFKMVWQILSTNATTSTSKMIQI